MYQEGAKIIERSNIQSDVVVVNQCDEEKTETFTFKNKKGEICSAKVIHTKERGLSRSRNMALRNACGDIAILCDDDEVFADDYVECVTEAYKKFPAVDGFLFATRTPNRRYSNKIFRIRFFDVFSIFSPQITFRVKSVKDVNILFDVTMGSGSGNGGGEENKFVNDLRHKGLNFYYYPYRMVTVSRKESRWFKGYTENWFFDMGWVHKKIAGTALATLYSFYALFRHRSKYKGNYSFFQVLQLMLRGVFCEK